MIAWRGVRGGTPLHGKSLCETCEYAHIIKGEATSEKVTRCNAVHDHPILVPFKLVTECTMHVNKLTPSIYSMERIAYILETDPKGKPIGFLSNTTFRKNNNIPSHDTLVNE